MNGTSEFKKADQPASETIGSILNDIQATANDLAKSAGRLDHHADNLFGSKPKADDNGKDEPKAQTVIQTTAGFASSASRYERRS